MMPLQSDPISPIDHTSLDCIKFTMLNQHGFKVFCVVTAQALRDLDSENETDLKQIFVRVRSRFFIRLVDHGSAASSLLAIRSSRNASSDREDWALLQANIICLLLFAIATVVIAEHPAWFH
jgi:hypothetical protein